MKKENKPIDWCQTIEIEVVEEQPKKLSFIQRLIKFLKGKRK